MKDDLAHALFRSRFSSPRSPRVVFLVFLIGSVGLLAGCGDDKKKDAREARFGDKKADKKEDSKFDRESLEPAGDEMKKASLGVKVPEVADPDGWDKKAADKKDDKKADDRRRHKEEDPKPAETKPADATPDKTERPKDKDKVGKPKPPKEKPKTPKVWHRDASRPTFARVYIGDKNSLELVSLHVSVTIEGPRARTVVDHVFRNPHDRQLEGTFEYPLPAGASPSYFAMFLGQTRDTLPQRRFRPVVTTPGKTPLLPESLPPAQLARQIDSADWGKLQEARVVAPEKALEAYEEVVRGRVDPGLLEYSSGNTFRGRVFPIAAKGYNRVILAYEETLAVASERLVYRFTLPACDLEEMQLSVQADPRACLDATFLPKDARKTASDSLLSFSKTWSKSKPSGEVVFSAKPADARVQTASGKHGDGPLYLYARLRPELPRVDKEEPFAKHAVILLDTSLSEHGTRFDVSMKLLAAILENDSGIEHFNVLAFNAGAAWIDKKGWLPNSKEGRATALSRLDGVVLEGATDLSSALEKLSAPDFAIDKGTPLACFLLSDGHLTWGQTEVASLVARFRKRCPYQPRFFCYRTGLGEENSELYEALTRDGGGIFQCFGEKDVQAAATAHRSQCLEVERVRFVSPELSEVLVAGRRSAVYPGGELIVTAQCKKPVETRIVVEGRFRGQKYAKSFSVAVREDGELAPRAWGEVAVASLLALNDPWMDDLITAYCQQFNIGSRAASFLVLENEADYQRFNLETEKGKTIKGDLGSYLRDAWDILGKETSSKGAFGKLLFQIDGRTKVLAGPGGGQVKKLLGLLSEDDCLLPNATVAGAILLAKNADKDYLLARRTDRHAIDTWLEECQRRHTSGDTDAAVRVLSSIIEEHPGRGDALRLVGYRLLDMNQPAQAARLFSRVLRQRPFEPHSFRDLARSLEDGKRFALSALLYESVLAGTWHNRFGDALKTVTREEYVRLLRAGLAAGKLTKEQKSFFSDRLEKLGGAEVPADLRVSITWNTDNTDVDLWVIEPNHNKVFYAQPTSAAGGQLSADQTQGYGPERYHIRTARKGQYKIVVHYFRANPNLLGGETHVNVVITRFAGTPKETVERHTVILRREKEEASIPPIKF